MKNMLMNAIMGVAVGDALGCPVQFESRSWIATREKGSVTGMEGWGTFNLPAGSWTDDTAMTLATLDSLRETGTIDLNDIMKKFALWLDHGEYTPYGYSFDIGHTCAKAICDYKQAGEPRSCGMIGEYANGNGSLMRIMPVVLFVYHMRKNEGISDTRAIEVIDSVAALTHNHDRANMACGIYYFLACAILDHGADHSLNDCLKIGMNRAMNYYKDES